MNFKAVVGEAILVVVAGLGLSLAANALSPRGLTLARDYFPKGTNASPAQIPVLPSTNTSTTNWLSEADLYLQRIHDKGLQELKRAGAEKLFHDPRGQVGAIVFIDARDPDHFAESHLPGAYEFDPYHPEKELNTVLPVCTAAEQVVVYCTGGECEDAETAAIMLRDAGIPAQKIFVYSGGFNEWSAAHLPLETGARGSGVPK